MGGFLVALLDLMIKKPQNYKKSPPKMEKKPHPKIPDEM